MRILLVCGARPNFVKVAALWHALVPLETVEAEILHTGQHYDPKLDAVFFDALGLPEPTARLDFEPGASPLPTLLNAAESFLSDRRQPPDLVSVVGDVTSTLALSLVAAHARIPLAHVEAGLRSRDRDMPEELNRLTVDALADVLFTSEPSGTANLRAEGVPGSHVFEVGNVMIDTLVRERPRFEELDLEPLGVPVDDPRGFALWTSHRPSNVDGRGALATLLETLLATCQRLPVVFPVHPRARQRLEDHTLGERLRREPNLMLLEPLDYHRFLALQSRARVVLTDSGGIQEETAFLGVPCLTLRTNTERPATLETGWNQLVGREPETVLAALDEVLAGKVSGGPPPASWDGKAAHRIARHLVDLGPDGLRRLQRTRS